MVGRALDGAQAVTLARELDPDVVLLDISMPGVGGFEAIEKIAGGRRRATRAGVDGLGRPGRPREGARGGRGGLHDEGADRRPARSSRAGGGGLSYPFPAMLAFFSVVHVLLSAALVTLILMHSGRDAGLRRHGLHAELAGRDAHRRAQPDPADRARVGAVLREHDHAVPAAGVAPCVLGGLHHVTCVCSDAQATTDFYRDELGLPLVKKTVNFDDPHSYHLYFGDETASPGSLMTFFEWPRAERGRLGRGTLESIGLETPAVSEEREVEDPDGLCAATLSGRQAGDPRRDRDRQPRPVPGPARRERADHVRGAGRGDGAGRRGGRRITSRGATPDDEEQAAWSERLFELGLRPTPQQERKYFRSIYFRMPDGILHRDRDRRPRVHGRRGADAARPGAFAAAVARARARDARARAAADHLRAWGSSAPPGLRMRWRGLEPPRPKGHKALNLARLPIPPPARGAVV